MDNDEKLKNYSNLQFWRLGKSAKLGVGDISINGFAILPAIPLWFYQGWPLVVFSIIYISFFIYARVRNVPEMTAIKQVRCLLAGKHRFKSKSNRAKRFTNADS
jgi:hypothetical protein